MMDIVCQFINVAITLENTITFCSCISFNAIRKLTDNWFQVACNVCTVSTSNAVILVFIELREYIKATFSTMHSQRCKHVYTYYSTGVPGYSEGDPPRPGLSKCASGRREGPQDC